MINSKRNTVLLIDPNYYTTEKLANHLGSIGFEVMTANTPDMALKLAVIARPDLILLDILMEGKNGADMLVSLKSNTIAQDIPVIILSTASDINSKVYSLVSGASDYITKPFHFEELVARINIQLKLLKMQKELEEKNKELLDKNAILQQIAITDGLTGVYNRTYILKKAGSEILRASRYQEMLSFIMLDIDHFKKINDTYGHLAGDIVLKEVAKQIKNSVRDVDIISRYGGEEFLIICPNTDAKGATITAERIRSTIENYIFTFNDEQIKVTVSLGIRNTIPKPSAKPDLETFNLIGDADIALYNAKANGRNRIEIFNPDDSLKICDDALPSNTGHYFGRPDKYTH